MGVESVSMYSDIETRRISFEIVLDRTDYFVFWQTDIALKNNGVDCSHTIIPDPQLSPDKIKIGLPYTQDTAFFASLVSVALTRRNEQEPHISDQREINRLVSEYISSKCLAYANGGKSKTENSN